MSAVHLFPYWLYCKHEEALQKREQKKKYEEQRKAEERQKLTEQGIQDSSEPEEMEQGNDEQKGDFSF